MNKLSELISYSLCFFCSALIGNGYSPVFSVMAETRRRGSESTGTISFFGVKLLNDIATGVWMFTVPHYFVHMIAYGFSKWGSIPASASFYLISNSVCFFQMAGDFYPFTIHGYMQCMAAGIPFFLRNVLGCLIMDFGFKLMDLLERHEFDARWQLNAVPI